MRFPGYRPLAAAAALGLALVFAGCQSTSQGSPARGVTLTETNDVIRIDFDGSNYVEASLFKP